MSSYDPYSPSSAAPRPGAAPTPAPAELLEESQEFEQPQEPGDESVPEGSSAHVLEWVGADKDRAQRALDAEEASGRARRGLVHDLQKILAGE